MSHTNMIRQYYAHFARKRITARSVEAEMEKNKQRAWPGIEPGTSSKWRESPKKESYY